MDIYNPFVPNQRAKTVIIDGRVDNEIISNLTKLGLHIIKTVKCNEVHESISYHPDICIHPVNHNTLVIAPNVYDYYKDIFRNTNIKLIRGERFLKRNYPNDISYNVARIGKYAIHNIKHMDEKLKFYLEKEGVQFVNVKQGYTKCSIAIVSDNAIITSDPSINTACKEKGIDVLFIKEGYINLPGFNYGFIGGATGCISENEFLFSGIYNCHPDKSLINEFLQKYGKKPILLSHKKIIDIGSIIPLISN